MGDQEAKDEAAKRRIINHMNEDHHDSIVRYLQHYHKLSSWTAFDGKISQIDLKRMIFICGGNEYEIPFDPPMSSYRDARERVVEIDKECRHALQQSEITVKEFLPPTGFYAIGFVIITAAFLGFSQRWWFAKGDIVEHLLGPAFARFCWSIQPWLITAMVTIHAAEAMYFVQNYLRKHSVNPRTLLFWQWVGTTFIEGQFAFNRFKKLVAKKWEEQQRQKH